MRGRVSESVLRSVFSVFFFTISATESANIFDAFSSSVDTLFTDQQEAPYTSIRQAEGYEEREYKGMNWVCSQETNIKESEKRQQDTFLKLFSYNQGENDKASEIEMSIPVSIEFKNGADTPATVSACFFIAKPFQANPPIPTDKNLTIVQRPSMTIFTRHFTGYIDKPSEWLKEATSLLKLVTSKGEKVRRDLMYWNAFDSPIKFWNRRNEVWILKDSQ